MAGVLDGVSVLDFGRYHAGPWCAAILGDFGAEVIRVERIGGGEDRFVVPLSDEEAGAGYLQSNRNKKSLTLNPNAPEGRRIIRKLVQRADVVVANLPDQALQSMGLDYASLCGIRPDIILTTINAFGPQGPWSHRVAFDGVAQAMSGQCYMTGLPGAPQKFYGPWVDFAAGSFAAMGTLTALMWREKTGQGQHVQSSMLMAALLPGSPLLMEQAVAQVNRQPSGNTSQVAAPADMYKTRDGWIIVQVASQALYKRWARLMGEESWLTDMRFKDDGSRLQNRGVLNERMARWCAQRTNEEALRELDVAMLPAGPVLSPQEVLDHEQVRAIGAFHPVSYPGLSKPAPLLRVPVELSATPPSIRTAPPTIGEHTEEILSRLGYDATQIADLRRAGVV